MLVFVFDCAAFAAKLTARGFVVELSYRKGALCNHGCVFGLHDSPNSVNSIKSNTSLIMVDKPQPSYNVMNVINNGEMKDDTSKKACKYINWRM